MTEKALLVCSFWVFGHFKIYQKITSLNPYFMLCGSGVALMCQASKPHAMFKNNTHYHIHLINGNI